MSEELRLEAVEAMLKDFQRATVDHVCDRFYGDDPTDRFLVADEVGLGKTLVARGVIARTIRHHLARDHDRIDIIYICSNADIARQNVSRLNVTGRDDVNLATRITLLPRVLDRLNESQVNFVSFTPGTSFNLRSSEGITHERGVVYHLLRQAWGTSVMPGRGPDYRVFQGGARLENMVEKFEALRPERDLNEDLTEKFKEHLARDDERKRVAGELTLQERYLDLRSRLSGLRSHQPPGPLRRLRREFVGEVRSLLARSCVLALDPQLVILDEFQRFRHILEGDSEAASLARELFTYEDVRVLLLSATPYKMYTLSADRDEDHYEDFLQTMRFLFDDEQQLESFTADLRDYRRALFHIGREGDIEGVRRGKERIEETLRDYMARTERLAVSSDRSGMLTEQEPDGVHLTTQDLSSYVELDAVGRSLGVGGMLEYWKSTAYPLNFMEGYKVDRELERFLDEGRSGELAQHLRDSDLLLDFDDVLAYAEIDPGNARLRALMADVVERGAWRMLWLAPSLPYYEMGGAYADPALRSFTKRLIFSSWTVVPKMISAMVTYAAEQRQIASFPEYPQENTPKAREAIPQLLTFTYSNERLTGMPVLALLYPSHALARLGDPRAIAAESGRRLAIGDVRGYVVDRIRQELSELDAYQARVDEEGVEDERWYWAAPLLLDREADRGAEERWWSQSGLPARWLHGDVDDDAAGSAGRWADHVEQARAFATGGGHDDDGPLELGPPPKDLAEVLADLAIAGPGVCSLRALSRVAGGDTALVDPEIRGRAGYVAWGLRSLFNLPETQALLRGNASADEGSEPAYWRTVLRYSGEGCLQAVLDEYAHVLPEWEGALGADDHQVARVVAESMREALGLRTASYKVADLRVNNRQLRAKDRRMRGLFALRFGDTRSEDEKRTIRQSHVRRAFNSPFWPFVLATTSIGQEGLDFHLYCHAIVHWNLPSNPVDLEQREGRIHRYKGHAIRKNLAQRFGEHALSGQPDGWAEMFERAASARAPGESELVPFWILTAEDGARIERYVPSLPLSREVGRLEDLKRSLAAYRLVFGQPRQDDLVAFLQDQMPREEIEALLGDLRIDLSPTGVIDFGGEM